MNKNKRALSRKRRARLIRKHGDKWNDDRKNNKHDKVIIMESNTWYKDKFDSGKSWIKSKLKIKKFGYNNL